MNGHSAPTPIVSDNLLGYFEWMRQRLGILTPKEARQEGACEGDEPPWAPEPSNYKLRAFIANACKLVNQHVKLADFGAPRDLLVPAQTADGPYCIDLGSVPGLPDRGFTSLRRAWWYDGATSTRLTPAELSTLDLTNDAYLNAAPSTPTRFAIDGYRCYLMPGPSVAGYFRYMAACGVLAPVADTDSFDQIPSDYDPCVLYVAIVDYGKSLPADVEMSQRAQGYSPDATAGLERLAEWFRGGSNEQVPAGMIVDTSSMRRGRSRR